MAHYQIEYERNECHTQSEQGHAESACPDEC